MFLFLSRDLKEKERYMDFARYTCVNNNRDTTFKGVARASVSDYYRSEVRGLDLTCDGWHQSRSSLHSPRYLPVLFGSELHSRAETHPHFTALIRARCADLRSVIEMFIKRRHASAIQRAGQEARLSMFSVRFARFVVGFLVIAAS